MIIHQTVPYFLENFTLTEEFIQRYQQQYAAHFEEYFRYHCKNPTDKLRLALEKYPAQLPHIKETNGKMIQLIEEIKDHYERIYKITFEKDVHLIVGMFGSNAFTHRQVIPEITFCLEKLSPKDEHLRVIIAHEFGHALHNLLSEREGIDWNKVDWAHPFTWLLQEGCATYFSTKAVSVNPAVYFSYDDKGEEWLHFAEMNEKEILQAFRADLQIEMPNGLFREWFSINGGTTFGLTRLGYYIGYQLLRHLMKKVGEQNAITVWKQADFHELMMEALEEIINGE